MDLGLSTNNLFAPQEASDPQVADAGQRYGYQVLAEERDQCNPQPGHLYWLWVDNVAPDDKAVGEHLNNLSGNSMNHVNVL